MKPSVGIVAYSFTHTFKLSTLTYSFESINPETGYVILTIVCLLRIGVDVGQGNAVLDGVAKARRGLDRKPQ